MYALAAYLLKMILASAILTGYYWLALRNKGFHRYNRFYLLSALGLSFAAPFLAMPWLTLPCPAIPFMGGLLPWIGRAKAPGPEKHLPAEGFLLAAGITVSALLLLILVYRIVRIVDLIGRHDISRREGYYWIETAHPQAPFSFFRFLFWKKGIPPDSAEGEKILLHELAHIRQKHAYDKLFARLMNCIFWMNPFYWIIQKELNMVHEFIADERSLPDRDTASFARILLLSYGGGSFLDPGHSFFQSPVKRRLRMLAASGKTGSPGLRKIMVLPLMAMVMGIFSLTYVHDHAELPPATGFSRSAKLAEERRWTAEGRQGFPPLLRKAAYPVLK